MRILLFTMLLLVMLTAGGQEEQDSPPEETGAEEEQGEDKPGKKPRNEFDTPDTFEATEQLSEDISAPFPVDI